MKSICSFLFLLILFFILGIKPIFAQSPLDLLGGKNIPGVSCGLPGATNGEDVCCRPITQQCPDLPLKDLWTNFPVLGHFVSQYLDTCGKIQTFQDKYSSFPCVDGNPTSTVTDPSCKCVSANTNKPLPKLAEMCYRYLSDSKGTELKDCITCSTEGIWTSLGCIPLNLKGFVEKAIVLGISFGGLFSFLCIIYSAFNIQISGGNPEKIKKSQETIVSCLIGLVMIIFSVFILKIIGVDILHIPLS